MRVAAIIGGLAILAAPASQASDGPALSRGPLGAAPPALSAESAIVIDAESGEELYAKDALAARYPASTTKIMTAMLLIERCAPSEIIVAPPDIQTVGEASMHLAPGERVSARDMLYAILLRSANDGCVAVADHIAGSVKNFARLMNERARQLGCAHTHFDNPNGLNDPKHTTCARDLAIIAAAAMRYPQFRAVVRLTRHKITRSIDQHDLWMVSKNRWLRQDPTGDGVKTGWTIPAGHCYVGSATRHGFRVITVVLKSDDWKADNEALLNWAFARYAPDPVELPANGLAVRTEDGRELDVGLLAPTWFLARKGKSAPSPVVAFLPAADLTDPASNRLKDGPFDRGNLVGEIRIEAPGVDFRRPAIALEPLAPARATKGAGFGVPGVMLGGVLAGGALAMRRKSSRFRRAFAKKL